MKFQFIKNQKAIHRVSRLCEVLDVSKSGFYEWLKREVSYRSKRNQALLKKIMVNSKDSNERYGSPRIHAELQAAGERVGKNRVAKLMRSARIQAKMHQKFKWVQKSRVLILPLLFLAWLKPANIIKSNPMIGLDMC